MKSDPWAVFASIEFGIGILWSLAALAPWSERERERERESSKKTQYKMFGYERYEDYVKFIFAPAGFSSVVAA